MSESTVKVVIPWRQREGADLRRAANMEVVLAWWWAHGFEPTVQSDGLTGDAQFNRHRAYNRAVEAFPETDVFVFTEADMLIHPSQIGSAVRLAARRVGLVVPFTQYRYWSDEMTEVVRDAFHTNETEDIARWWNKPIIKKGSVFQIPAESTMENGRSIGAVNVVSRETLKITGGFTEATSGNWYDDNIIEEGFAFLTGNPTQYIPGPAVHMYHLPGHKGDHLTEEDRKATQRNKDLLAIMRQDIKRGNRLGVRTLLATRDLTASRS